MIANLIGAGVGAIIPVVMEAMRDKPDPEAAKSMLRSQRQARIEQNIGAGMSMQQAEKQVDAQLQQEFAAADEAGEFNTPWGEMVAGAVLGGVAPWAATKGAGMVKGAAAAGKFGKRLQGVAGPAAAGAAGATDDVAAAAAKAAKIDTPAEQALVRPASGQSKVPDLVSADELAPVQMRAEAMSRMQPSAMDIRNTRMLNNVPAPKQTPQTRIDESEIDRLFRDLELKAPATKSSPFPPKPMSVSDDIAAKLEARQAYDARLRSMDNTDPALVSAVDDMVPASRPQGPFPEFLPGEMQSRTPSAMLRPWESIPEVEGAIVRKQLGKLKADPRGAMASMRSPFPDMETDRMRAALYGQSGG